MDSSLMRAWYHLKMAVFAGAAAAAPAFASDRATRCPNVPTTNDSERARSGGASLQIGGFGLNGERARSRTETDVMMRHGGFESWSAAAVFAHSCQLNQRIYSGDPQRERDELIALRDRLLGRQSTPAPYAKSIGVRPLPAPSMDNHSKPDRRSRTTPSWTFAELWKSKAQWTYFPAAAKLAGLHEVAATLNCNLGKDDGLSACRIVAEHPAGVGSGLAVLHYALSLELTREARRAVWTDRRVQFRLMLSRYR